MKSFQKLLSFSGLFFISASLMMAQVLLLRFSRVAFIIDLQFIIISSAILGYGLGNLVVYLWFNHADNRKTRQLFTQTGFFYAIFSLIPFFILHFANRYPQVVIAPLFFVSELALYTLAGIPIALTFRYHSTNQKTHLIYLANMVGSGIGAFLIIFLLDYLGIFAIYINFVFALIAFLFYLHTNNLTKGTILLSVLIVLFLFPSRLRTYVQVVCNPNGKLISSLVNSFRQVDLYEKNREYTNKYEIIFECSNTLSLPSYRDLQKTKSELYSFPYLIGKYDTAAIIGSGGGSDVADAILSGVKNITAIEINPMVIKTVYIANPENIYQNKAVKLVLREGRDYMNTTNEKFNLIIIPTSKNFGNSGLRSFALQENYLYTNETMGTYLNHLTDHGSFAILEHNVLIPQYLSTVKEALISNHKNPKDVVVIQGKSYGLILYKNQGFNQTETTTIDSHAKKLGFSVSNLDPNLLNPPPITNNKPYLEYKNIKVPELAVQSQTQRLFRGLMYFLTALSIFYVLFMLIVSHKSYEIKKAKYALSLFTLTGVGFISAELYLMEKISLILGHPSLSIAIALSLLLIFGGIGGLLAGKIHTKDLAIATLLLSTLTLYLFGLDYLINTLSTIHFRVRFIVAIFVLAFPGMGMGLLFGICLKKIQSISGQLLPLVLTIDGFASILGGVIFKVTTLSTGFRVGLFVAIICYAGALVILKLTTKNIPKSG